MPYIKKEDRPQYVPMIENMVSLICSEKDKHRQLDCLSFFIDHLMARLDRGYTTFNGDYIDVDKKHSIVKCIDHVREVLEQEHDMFAQAGNLNYVLSGIIWGVLGDSLHAEPAKYGFRTFVKGILWTVYEHINPVVSEKLTTMLKGVFTDIIDEMYRRKTSPYEDEKIIQNGDVWPLRGISWIEEVPIEVVKGETWNLENDT
jgi:hypothetical protein